VLVTAQTTHKILMYSHDTYGLGHIRRTLAIARSLRKQPVNILILTGSPLVGRFNIPSRIDFVRIPGMIKVTNDQYQPLSIKLDAAEVLEIRKNIILATAKSFRPDFFIVDKAPLGLKREVVDTLHWLKTDLPNCKSVLGLRDIMDGAEITIEDWKEKGIYEAMEQLYHEIWVYGCRELYDPIVEYRIPPQVASKIHFTGYIPRQIPSAEETRSVLAELGIRPDEKVLLNTFLDALQRNPLPAQLKVVIVTGPFISRRHFPEVVQRCRQSGFIALKFHRYMEALIGGANVVVSMGGYNTVCEIISQRKPFLIVPRTVPREEQLIRAQVLCQSGLCDYLHPNELTPAALWEKLSHLLANGTSYSDKMAVFPLKALEIIQDRVFHQTTGN
jgi:predicted glycosyltransferase